MRSLFPRQSSPKTALYLALGVVAAQCFGLCAALQMDAQAQEAETPQNQELQTATEAQMQDLWSQMQADSIELEGTDARAAITRYQKFFEQGAGRFPSVGVKISLRIARLWQIDLGDYDKAIEIYEWALGTYKNEPEVVLLQKGRLAAEQAQNKAEAAQGKKGPLPPKVPGTPPLVVPVPQSTGGGKLGINLPSSTTGGKFGVGLPSSANGGKLGVDLPATGTGSSKVLSVIAPRVVPPGNALGWHPGPQRSITALTQQQDGTLWVATEDSGVWRYNPSVIRLQDRWQQFTTNDGLGDDSAYALAVDKLGRLWVGTLNHGVSVWNGKTWKNYGVLDGPLGERVFAIKTCPTDGDVWIATNAGLTRYSLQKDTWTHFTRGDGLPSNQIQAIAFDRGGNILLGTQCDGVAMAQVADGYKMWRAVKGPEEMPVTATGKGLPSSLINDVMVAKDGTFYAATTTGLAWSSDQGTSWSYVRGQDYAAKIQGLYSGPPAGWKEQPGAILAEDYVLCMAQDEAGRIWLGHWQAGSEMVQMQSGPTGVSVKGVFHRQDSGLVRAMMSQSEGTLLLARYNEGLSYGSSANGNQGNATAKLAVIGAATAPPPSLPTTAKAPTLGELNTLLASLGKTEPLGSKTPSVTELDEDWTTQGDWLGRYGRYWASLNAMISPQNYLWGAGWQSVNHRFQISPKQKEDSLRYYITWLQTDNPRSLEMPPVYLDSRIQKGLNDKAHDRRQSELDDHGEDYPLTKEGPDIYFSVKVPSGLWTLSFYNHNKDGHDGLNRMRDYPYSIRSLNPTQPIDDVADFDAQPELAHSRQRDFAGGVYKRFLVRGPQQLTVKVSRNNSHNTIMGAAFLDLVDERPAPYFGTVSDWRERQNAYAQEGDELNAQSAEERHARFAPATDEKDAANRLFIEVERLRDSNPPIWVAMSRPAYQALARWIEPTLKGANAEETHFLLSRQSACLYNLMRYNAWENVQRRQGLTPARDIEKSLKWDTKSDFSSKGYQTVTAHLSKEGHAETQ